MTTVLANQSRVPGLLHHSLLRNSKLCHHIRQYLQCSVCRAFGRIANSTRQQKDSFFPQNQCTLIASHHCHARTFVSVSSPEKSRHVIFKHNSSAPNCAGLFTHKLLSACTSLMSPRQMSSVKKPVVSRFTEDIDLDSLREELRLERKTSGQNVQLVSKIKEAVAAKCDAAVANLSEADAKSLKVIQLEHNFLYSEGYHIPSLEEMTSENWLEAMGCKSKNQRLKYYLFLQRRKVLKENFIKKREEKKQNRTVRPMNSYEHGKIFMRIYESTMKRWNNYRLASAMQYGVPLVIDMDFEKHMRPQEIRNTAHQLLDLYAFNRLDDGEPFHLHFTSCSETNSIYRMMQILFQDNQDFLATVTENSYLDLFKKQELVYLSPNGRQVLREFDPNTVYIVGAFNDKATQEPVTFAKARQQNIKCLRLPLDEHISWVSGGKDLTLDQMIKILLSVKKGKSWDEAFQFIPKRKRTARDR
ncbi:mitochondrial ribonuclease P protein 1 homolog [Aplysia californica]|uniref:RNA (guanine-9-)-methyltransferase domain-containing protein 1 n=1 Tax=Aplysia californica TaxID=6500 RepID=A0ABM0JS43_APLCA|nr:mitochondrial ribonuclease P protein 1 homolog [Aplysia californica]XP_005100267.1 mitochondrial ribonuclease P protein 1 homolog [Aplysia californica]XP_005100268.1 mitochondrial ribonuclease P protein 1 homolog [Aplysia californica]XP_005100269.1 mitochondrial ribonuclease P protein 1 homolog [Aplysia californica]